MDTAFALAYYRKNYLFGVARPGALSFDGANLALHANDLSLVWAAPLSDVKVTNGTGILTAGVGVYAKGQRSLRDFFAALGVMD